MKQVMSRINKAGQWAQSGLRKSRASVLGAGLALLAAGPAMAWDYSNVPLFWSAGAQPNVMLLMDDSGSMLYMTYNQAYSEYLLANPTTANAYQTTLVDDTGDLYDKEWFFCSSLSVDGKSCGSTVSMTKLAYVDSSGWTYDFPGFAVQTPVKIDTSKKGHNYIFGSDRNELANHIVTCDVTKFTSSKFTTATSTLAAQNIGVMVTDKSGIAACVRWKEASTAVSPRQWNGTACGNTGVMTAPHTNNYCLNSIDAYTWYEYHYAQYLLTRNVTASGAYNFSNTIGSPPADTVTVNSKYPDEATATISNPSDPAIMPALNRMEAARRGAKQVVADNYNNLRIGFARFWDDKNGGPGGGDIKAAGAVIGSSKATIDSKIAAARPAGGTPLIAATYETYRYFAGLRPEYGTPNGSTAFDSPIQYRCQKNYVVALTGGEPSSNDVGNSASCNTENNVPTRLGDLVGWPANSLDYDGQPDGCVNPVSGNKYDPYLDDFSQWAYDKDLKTATSSTPSACYGGETPPATAGMDCAGKGWDADTTYAKQNVGTYTVGFGLKNDMLVEAPETAAAYTFASTGVAAGTDILTIGTHTLSTGNKVLYRKATVASGTPIAGLVDGREYYVIKQSGTQIKLATTSKNATAGTAIDITGAGTGSHVISQGPGSFYLALTADELSTRLGNAFSSILKITSSASAVATNSTRLNGDTRVYQARFNTEDWSGNLQSFPISTTNGEVNTSGTPDWEARNTVTAAARGTLLTSDGTIGAGTGIQLSSFANFTASQKASLNNDANTFTWLKGTDVTGYRERKNGIVGDIINSDPAFVGALNFGYMRLPEGNNCATTNGTSYDAGSGCTGGLLYNAFVEKNKTREGMIYFGANDGWLHGLNGKTGMEKVAYLPNGVFNVNGEKKLFNLTQPDYSHRYFVDGSPFVGDAYLGSWGTYLVSGLGLGGKSVFALDVTDDTFAAADVKWEFSHAELGFTMSRPLIARMMNGEWAAIFGNGPGSASNKGQLFIVNLSTGKAMGSPIGVNDGTGDNGLTAVQVQLNGERTVTAIYAGDLQGNIWKFDVSKPNANQWGLSHKVFQATDGANPQPITGGIRLGSNPKVPDATMVFFGTGKYFETTDSNYDKTPVYDSFYGVLDRGSTVSQASLVEQMLAPAGDYRTITTKDVNYLAGDNGWFLKLAIGGNYEGERVVSNPTLHGGRIIFVSLVPASQDRCVGGGSSWLYEIDALSGGLLGEPVFDTNGDGKVDDQDAKVAGLHNTDGIMSEPTIIKAGDDVEYKLLGSTSASKPIVTVMEDEPDADEAGNAGVGRMSWSQLQ